MTSMWWERCAVHLLAAFMIALSFHPFFFSTDSKMIYSRQELIIMVADSKILSDVLQFAADSDGRHSVSRQVSPLHT